MAINCSNCVVGAENVTRWERTVQDAEDELEAGRQAEAKQRQDIDRELRRVDALKADRSEAKQRQQRADDDVAAVPHHWHRSHSRCFPKRLKD